MICYFSATGNCKHVAETIAVAAKDSAVSIEGLDPGALKGESVFGLVSPVYFWGLPTIVERFLKQVRMDDCRYSFFVATYGTTPGYSGKQAAMILREDHIGLDASFSIKMPDTWTPMFDLSDPEFVAE